MSIVFIKQARIEYNALFLQDLCDIQKLAF
jgi:hypothetical protein